MHFASLASVNLHDDVRSDPKWHPCSNPSNFTPSRRICEQLRLPSRLDLPSPPSPRRAPSARLASPRPSARRTTDGISHPNLLPPPVIRTRVNTPPGNQTATPAPSERSAGQETHPPTFTAADAACPPSKDQESRYCNGGQASEQAAAPRIRTPPP